MIKKRLISILLVIMGVIILFTQNVSIVQASNRMLNVETLESFPVMRKTLLVTKIKIEKVAHRVTREVEKKKAVEEKAKKEMQQKKWKGEVLTASKGVMQGPSGKETYYNLNMSGVVKIMRRQGYSEDKYPYYVREDGVKMLGPYVMCAANLNIRPRGSLIETSLGTAIVCDTGGFAKHNSKQVDIAVSW